MSQCDPSKACAVCDQQGLALMPLRYAVAQPATKSAPAIQAPFGEGLEAVPLPTDNAHYTVRHLRGGYLYVFNEVRGEWKAYVVNEDAYLVEYDIHDKTPPNLSGARPCSRMAKSAASRCVMIPDAIRAGAVWLGFSDVAWTDRVLERHRQAAYRDKHMRRIDLGAWAKSQTVQPHLTGLSKAREVVAEYHLPAQSAAASQTAAPHLPGIRLQSVNVHGYKAFMHSPQDFQNCDAELEAFLVSAQTSGRGVPPAMVALADPLGITLELNALTLGRVERFEQEDDRDWKKTTSTAIQGLRQMLEEDAVATALARHQGERYATFEGMPLYPEWDEAARERNATLPKLAQIDVGVGVVGGILDGWNAYMAVQLVDKEGYTAKSSVNLTAAFSLTGAGADIAHRVWSRYPIQQLRLANTFQLIAGRWRLSLGRLGTIAKWLGALGGILTSLVDLMSGLEALGNGDLLTAGLRFATAGLGALIVILVVFSSMTAGVGFILFLMVAGISMLGDWLIGMFKKNGVEIWLDKTPFGAEKVNGYEYFEAQQNAWFSMVGGKEYIE